MDAGHKNRIGNENDGQLNTTPSKPVEGPSQKLALNDKLYNAFCTQAGLSAEAINQIWHDAQGNEQVRITGVVLLGYQLQLASFYYS